MKRTLESLFVALLAACSMAGCSDVSASEQPAERADSVIGAQELKDGQQVQAGMLADGTASRDEYLRSVTLLGECLERHDVRFHQVGWNPVDHRSIDYTYANERRPDDTVLAIGKGCQEAYLDQVQSAYKASVKPYMEPDILAAAKTCVSDLGMPTNTTDSDVNAMITTAGAGSRQPVSKCVAEAARAKYPDRTITVRG